MPYRDLGAQVAAEWGRNGNRRQDFADIAWRVLAGARLDELEADRLAHLPPDRELPAFDPAQRVPREPEYPFENDDFVVEVREIDAEDLTIRDDVFVGASRVAEGLGIRTDYRFDEESAGADTNQAAGPAPARTFSVGRLVQRSSALIRPGDPTTTIKRNGERLIASIFPLQPVVLVVIRLHLDEEPLLYYRPGFAVPDAQTFDDVTDGDPATGPEPEHDARWYVDVLHELRNAPHKLREGHGNVWIFRALLMTQLERRFLIKLMWPLTGSAAPLKTIAEWVRTLTHHKVLRSNLDADARDPSDRLSTMRLITNFYRRNWLEMDEDEAVLFLLDLVRLPKGRARRRITPQI